MTTSRSVSWGVIVTLACAAGCGGASPRPAAPAPIENQPPPTPAVVAMADDDPPPPEPEDDDLDAAELEPAAPPAPIVSTPKPPIVKLLARGNGKRMLLRYGARTGYRCELAMTMSMSGLITMTTPTMVMQWTGDPITIKNGVLTAHDEFGTPDLRDVAASGLPPEAVAEMRRVLVSLEGARVETLMTTQGVVLSSTITPKHHLDPSVLDSLATASAGLVFPSESIGVGGRWQVDRESTQSSMLTTYQTVYELVRRTGTVAVIRVSVTMKGASVPGAAMAFTTSGTGSGEMSYAGEPCPTSTISVATDTLGAAAPLKTTIASTVTPGPAPATVAP